MTKILVITESININDSSGSKANVGLIRNLKSAGYSVRVIHYNQEGMTIDDITSINAKEIKFSTFYLLSRIQRILQRIFKINLSVFLENSFGNSFTFFNDAKGIARAIKKHYKNDDLIITASKGGSFRPHYAMLKLPHLHKKWLAYVHDPYPFQYYPEPYKEDDKGFKFKESFFRKVSEKAAYSGFPSLLLKDWMGGFFPNFLKTGIVIPHQNLVSKTDETVKIPDYFDPNKFSLLHAGTLLKGRNPEGLLKGYLLFLDKNPKAMIDSSLLLLGPCVGYDELYNSVKAENIFWNRNRVPFKDVNYLQENVTVNIILEAVAEISPFLPGKFPHCVSANKPVLLLGPKKSECNRLFGEDYPYSSEANDIQKISMIIEDLYDKWQDNKSLKLDRLDLQEYFDIPYLNKQISSIFEIQ